LAFAAKGDAQQAETEWREAVRLRPNLSEAWLALTKSAAQKSDWRSVEKMSEQLKKHAPNSVDAYLFHATARINQGDAVGAEADLMNLQKLGPQNPLYYLKMGELRLAQRRVPEAEAMFHQALAHDPNSFEAIQGLVQVDEANKKPADALKLVQDQVQRNPKSPRLLLLRAELQIQAKQLEQAEASLNQILDLDNKNVPALALLAQLQSQNGQLEKGIALYQRALDVSPRDTRFQLALGALYERTGNWQGAQSTYQKILTIEPDNPLASNNLAYLYLEHGGNPNVALTLAQTARRGLPNLPNSADTLGWAYYNNGGYSVAAPLLEGAVKATPANQTYRYHLGLTYQKLNDATRAKAEFEKIIALDPNSDVASHARQALNGLKGT